jgi:Zn-dependent peptidase ImmA (M78 family)
MRVRRKHIEELADNLLKQNRVVQPPIVVGALARSLGLEIVKQDADDSISGMLINEGDGKGGIIGVNRAHHLNRQRFTIAHEIGHFLLQHYQGVHFDGANTGLQINFRDNRSTTGEDIFEREANLFAAELLMPRKLLEADLQRIKHPVSLIDTNDKTLKDLAKRYQVSVRAITFRLSYLGRLEL